MNALIELADSKIRLLEKEARRRINMTQYQDEEDLSSIVGAPAITDLSDRQKSGFKFRFVYAYLLFKTCYECSSPEQKLRFLPIKHFSLCHECSKLNKYDMINNETAELEYSVTKYDLNKHEIEGLKVPDPSKPGKSMLVYYLNDILHISRLKGDNNPKITSVQKRELEDKRKVEIMYLLKQENIDDRFIEQFIYNEGTPGNNYIQGKSRRSVNQIVATIKKKYLKALQRSEIDEEETVRLQEPEMIIPLKKPKLELDESQKNRRRAELTERISLMGIALHEVDMRDNDGIFMAYVNGRTKQELGQVAGAI